MEHVEHAAHVGHVEHVGDNSGPKSAPEVHLIGIIPRIGINHSSPRIGLTGGKRGEGGKKKNWTPGAPRAPPQDPPGHPRATQGPGGSFLVPKMA